MGQAGGRVSDGRQRRVQRAARGASAIVALAIVWAALPGSVPAAGSARLAAEATSGGQLAPVGLTAASCPAAARDVALPAPEAELHLVRDSAQNYWLIQAGCRHRVVPFVMDAAALAQIPQGEDIDWVTIAPVPPEPPSPLPLPAYAVPPGVALAPPAPPTPTVPTGAPSPGVLTGYTNGVLVVDSAQPEAVWLLDGGLRHRVVVHFTYCAVYPRALPLCRNGDSGEPRALNPEALARGGDPALAPPYPYLLPRRAEAAADCGRLYPELFLPPGERCADLYYRLVLGALLQARAPRDARERATWEQLARVVAAEAAGYVATIDEIPLGEPAPYYGWARGESVRLGDRVRPSEAADCGQTNANSQDSCTRLDQTQQISLQQYQKDPDVYNGRDVRVVGTACQVRVDRARNAVTFSLIQGSISLSAIAYGRGARGDARLVNGARLEVGASVSSGDPTMGVPSGQLVVFGYRHSPRDSGIDPCPQER